MEKALTKESNHALKTLYKAYKKRRRAKKSKDASVYFNIDTEEGKYVCSKIKDCIPELKKAGFIKCFIDGSVVLEDKAIIYKENLRRGKIKDGLSTVSLIRSIFKS